MKRLLRLLPGPLVRLLTPMLAGGGAALAFAVGSDLGVAAGLLLHLGAAASGTIAARRRRGGPLAQAERDAVITTSLLVPFLGPVLAMTLPRKAGGADVVNAHQAMERYRSHVKPSIPEYERSLFTGDFDRDLARKLDLETYRDVLRHGHTDQKRSALFRLAELGQPHHLALIRRCLTDEDQEVRLYAYGELERLVREHEERIARARARIREEPGRAEAHLELARAQFDLGVSGVLDSATAGFHLRVAVSCAVEARRLDPASLPAAVLQSRALAKLGDREGADACLASLPEEMRLGAEALLADAETAFAARDFGRAREAAEELRRREAGLPGWLEALLAAEPDEDGGGKEDGGEGNAEEIPAEPASGRAEP